LQETANAKASPIVISDDEYEEDGAAFWRELQRTIELEASRISQHLKVGGQD
jgi:hypothetical protein